MTRFDRDTSVTRLDATRFEARMDRGWWISRGPNGGYVSAILLRAMTLAVDDAERLPRSFTVHFTAPPDEGAVRIDTVIERTGRSMTTTTARLLQGERLCALAIGAFSRPRRGPEFQDAEFPRVVPPERALRIEAGGTPMRERYENLVALPEAIAEADPARGTARTGGWIRLREPQPADACVIVAVCDAWPPALRERDWPDGQSPPAGFPTVDLTVHFRVGLPLPDLDPESFLLAQFRTRTLGEGFLEEDGEIWTPDGRLVAHSRQLGVVL